MSITASAQISSDSIVQEAAAAVAIAIDAAVARALHEATVCGCPGCRAAARDTLRWARALTAPSNAKSEEEAA